MQKFNIIHISYLNFVGLQQKIWRNIGFYIPKNRQFARRCPGFARLKEILRSWDGHLLAFPGQK